MAASPPWPPDPSYCLDFEADLDAKERGSVGRLFDAEKENRVKRERNKKRRVWGFRKKTVEQADKEEKELRELIDIEHGDPELPQCYEEIKKLIVIEKYPIYAKALEEWSRKETLFTSRVERKQKRVANLKNEIYQLIGFFSVFQGVLLTAVAQSSLLHCNNWWSPILLSLVASVVSIAAVVQKLIKIQEFQKTIHSEEHSLKVVVARLNTLRGAGVQKFEFAKFVNKQEPRQSRRWFWTYFSVVIGSLIIFTAGFPLSHWRILCYSGEK